MLTAQHSTRSHFISYTPWNSNSPFQSVQCHHFTIWTFSILTTGKRELCVIYEVDEKFKIYCWFVFGRLTLFIQTPRTTNHDAPFYDQIFNCFVQFALIFGITFWYFPLQFKLRRKPTVWLDSSKWIISQWDSLSFWNFCTFSMYYIMTYDWFN